MDYSDAESGSDHESIDEILGGEDLFSDEAEEDNDSQSNNGKTEDKMEAQEEEPKSEKKEKKIRQPRIVKNPRVTLNFESLRGKNGLSALKSSFKKFKFKGSGHEVEDLTKIMEILQQWMCFQLCPSYNFESCMLQLEALGKKKVVQTLMKKYRLGMDEWGEKRSDEENNCADEKETEIDGCVERTDNFDLLLDEEINNAESDTEIIPNPDTGAETVQKEPEFVLTQEQLDRIARNKKLAEERRQKRMSTQNEPMEVTQLTDISVDKINLEENS